MAPVNHAATPASQRRTGAMTLAAILYCWLGLAFLISSLLIDSFALRNGTLPVVFGIRLLSGPFSERLGPNAALAAAVPCGHDLLDRVCAADYGRDWPTRSVATGMGMENLALGRY
jgi:hypothetical protein